MQRHEVPAHGRRGVRGHGKMLAETCPSPAIEQGGVSGVSENVPPATSLLGGYYPFWSVPNCFNCRLQLARSTSLGTCAKRARRRHQATQTSPDCPSEALVT